MYTASWFSSSSSFLIFPKVVDFNEEDHKISLSVKALLGGRDRYEDADIADVDIDSYSRRR